MPDLDHIAAAIFSSLHPGADWEDVLRGEVVDGHTLDDWREAARNAAWAASRAGASTLAEDYAIKLLHAPTGGDKEDDHEQGDKVVSDALRALGWGRLADAYDKARDDWWYS